MKEKNDGKPLNIKMSKEMRDFIDKAAPFGNASMYVKMLIKREMDKEIGACETCGHTGCVHHGQYSSPCCDYVLITEQTTTYKRERNGYA